MQRRVLLENYRDVREVLRRSSPFARRCSGAEALEQLTKTSVDDTSTIVKEELVADLEAELVSLPQVPESA